MTLDRDPLTIELARAFADRIRDQFDAFTLEEIVRRNDSAGYRQACATHDFCDSNKLMLAAMAECGIAFDPANAGQAQLTDAAWSLAKAASFTSEDILGPRNIEQGAQRAQ